MHFKIHALNFCLSMTAIPVDKNRSTTGGQSGPPYLQLWLQQEDSPDHASWDLNVKKGTEHAQYMASTNNTTESVWKTNTNGANNW